MWAAHLITLVDITDPRQILPPRKGAMILVLGGTAVLAISLVSALVRGGSRLQHRSDPTPSVGPRPKRLPDGSNGDGPPRSRLDEHQVLLKTAARAGTGTPRLVTANPGPNALVLVECLRCRASDDDGCEWKRSSLEQALRQFHERGRVEKVSCRPDEPEPCIFEIQTGEAGS